MREPIRHIRNFSIIAHIDHGKSTLADRMLELTGTIEKRKMKDQVLDSMDLERERGITIKMQPVRMEYKHEGEPFILNLIDTPGHIDFSYEVSRALKAVEGSVLLVDATQGVQAQTLTVLATARELGVVLVPVVSKIDSPLARTEEVKEEVAKLIGCSVEEVLEVSGKTGDGVEHLIREIIRRVPPPSREQTNGLRALVFDFSYSEHKGIILYVRVFEGSVARADELVLVAAKEKCSALAVGIFHPDPRDKDRLEAGEIGYIVTGIKKPGVASVGDTITTQRAPLEALPGYMNPRPVVWASLYPESQDDFTALRQALERLRLTDPALSFEEEASTILGRGFRAGFLGMLHLEIISERLTREFGITPVMTTPSITYEVEYTNGKKETIYTPAKFPDHGTTKVILEPWVTVKIILPPEYVGPLMVMLYDHEAEVGETELFGDNRTAITAQLPLRELMRNFFDELKSVTSGFASLSYEIVGMRSADVARLDVLVADEPVPAFAKVVSRKKMEREAESSVERLHKVLPRQMFVTKIQGRGMGRIISSRTLSAMRKDVTGYLYGGDITRKMKLLEKQKKGKKKMKEHGKVNIPQDVFLKMIKGE
ncbi:MAG: elongation factor 4 [Candidatus Yonathbacteria bacterium RIFOXYC1_FULL_52_10]|uniref:Elongation factor 4 n=1 Tax=Candidatus Yonathbacteria bacterium RIFOXYD1_FULL_52_36 TaxID=1802730 RepID=A0A1G2SMC7_9BACT|nr:MAG: elongation factor 4 [Candidatus Yonathbacteria bacterium RIFOXYC1_FULL_52_10]OHA86094.1 MAG: elongation factor 4 [Candidatus Yonathbacteria bacterium RIFOXYD1_FULL_52_36]